MTEQLTLYTRAIEEYLSAAFTEQLPQKTVLEAMRYSLLAGGKRIRPVLTLEFARLCGADWREALPVACALEMIHTYSLIHDDLPCMDNDDYRRGRLTNHRVYGEATAVLAGDGLLTAAFDTAASAHCPPERLVSVIRTLSRCAGPYGMVGGQQLDLEGEQKRCTDAEIREIHRLKTGALLSAACELGVLFAGGTGEQLSAAKAYAQNVGLAFQLRDDILDVIGDSRKLGKKTGMDEKKNTLVKLYGVEACEKMVCEETEQAIAAVGIFETPQFLTELARMLAKREH